MALEASVIKLVSGCEACEVATRNRAECGPDAEHEVFGCRKGHEQGHSGSCHECGARVTVAVRWERA